MGQQFDGLYLLQSSSLQQTSSTALAIFLASLKLNTTFNSFSATTTSHSALSSLWHFRLSHPLDYGLQALSHVFPFLQNSCNNTCGICPLAK